MRLFCGDCLMLMNLVPTNSVDLILADPPYGTTECKWDSIIDIEAMWKQLKRVIKPGGAILLCSAQPFTSVLVTSNIKQFKYDLVWEKPNATGFLNAKKQPLRAHESVLVFYDKLPTYNPQMTHGHKRSKTQRKPVNSECYGKSIKLTEYDSTSRYPRSVQKFSSDKQRELFHPTQKPVDWMKWLIETYSNPGDTVLDFCMGSGTTGVAALRANRQFIGIEQEQKYFDIAKERMQKEA